MLYTKVCVPNKTNDINVKEFNVITSKSEAKTIVKDISRDCKCKLNCTTWNWNQKWNNETCLNEWKSYQTCKKGYSWNPSISICENGIYKVC